MNRWPRFSFVCLPALALSLIASTAAAVWVPGGANGPVPPNIVSPFADGSGNFISFSKNSSVMTKRNSADVTLWNFTLTAVTTFTPEMAISDGNGGAIATSSGDINAGHVSSSGSAVWGPVMVCNATGVQSLTSGAMDAAGNIYLSWRDERSGYNYYVQKLSPGGLPQWTANGVLVTSLGLSISSASPVVVPDEAGGCFVAWNDVRGGTAVGDIYAQRIASNGVAAWAANGIPICNAAGLQDNLQGVSDDAGGAILEWVDQRSGNGDIYAQRIDGTGASLWTANGLGVCVMAGPYQGQGVLIRDGAGGAFTAWEDCRLCGVEGTAIYAQHLNSSGTGLWTANGAAVATGTSQKSLPRLVSDGAGGIIVSWLASTPWAQRLNAFGVAQWAAGGLEQLANPIAFRPFLVTDGAGGAYIGGEYQSGSSYLGRVTPSGEPAWVANYRATIASVVDAPGDEGGAVSLTFNPPMSETAAISPNTNSYSIWRKRPGSASAGPARLIDTSRVFGSSWSSANIAKYSDFPAGVWESVGYIPAIQAASYVVLAPTHADSTGAGSTNDDFVVLAHTPGVSTSSGTRPVFVVSAVGSGYSVDNLAPGPPQQLIGGYAGGTTVQIHWSNNPEADLWHYSVYKGTSADFTPSAGNRIGQPTTASLQDDAYQPGVSYYKVSAVDRHQNESAFSLLSPSQITSVPPGFVPARAYLASPAPNPFQVNSSVEYGITRQGLVQLEIYDLRGRRTARLVDEVESAGVRRVIWDGLDDRGQRAGAGIYLLRFRAEGLSQEHKLIRI